nr:glycosyltransferase family 4 protein [Paenibacillus swuensis]
MQKSTGLGTASREYAVALHRQGVDIKILSSRRSSSPSLITSLSNKRYAANKPKVLIHHGLPHQLNWAKARRTYDYILLNTVWETTKVPRSWFPSINLYDAICVPSVQNKTALRNSGVKVPVFLVPHGVHTRTFTPRNRKKPLPFRKGTFIFVSVFTFQHRKNPETLLRAFWEEFSATDKAALVIKTSGFGSRESGAWIRRRIRTYKKRLNLRKITAPLQLITGYTSPRSLKGLYTAGNAFVLPTRGEGVGLPFLESLASGVPVISTRWGGQMDFLNDRNSYLVSYQLKPPALRMKQAISRTFRPLFAQPGQRWAEPSLSSLKKQMRKAYADPTLCRRKGAQGRSDMKKQSWRHAGQAMKQAVEYVIRNKKRKF